MLRFTVHVVGHEGGTSLNSGGFDWYFKKPDADLKYVNSLLNKAVGEIIYQGEVEVFLPDELESIEFLIFVTSIQNKCNLSFLVYFLPTHSDTFKILKTL